MTGTVIEPLSAGEDIPARETPQTAQSSYEVILGPRRGWGREDLAEILRYRDLLTLLTWRTIRVRYAQSAVGLGWAIIQPLFQMVMFTLVFGRIAQIPSDGVPYAAFSLVALVPWTYFSNAVQGAAASLVANAGMISRSISRESFCP